jgi:ribonuclease Z
LSCIKVILAGTGSAINPHRGQVSLLLDMGGSTLVVDVGCSAPNVVERLGYRLDEVEHFIVTHTHYDHLCGLPMVAFIKTFRSREPELKVYTVASGVDTIRHVLNPVVAGRGVSYSIHPVTPGSQVLVGDGEVMFIEASHTIETVGVVVRYAGLKVVISSDTRPTEAYALEAEGASLAVHEATLPSTMRREAAMTGHTVVEDALKQVSRAEQAVLYHLTPWSEVEAMEATARNKRIQVVPDGTIVKIC